MASPLASNPGVISGRLAGQVNDGEGTGSFAQYLGLEGSLGGDEQKRRGEGFGRGHGAQCRRRPESRGDDE